MKDGDIIICHKNFMKDGEKLLTKGNKYHIHMGNYTYEGDERIFTTTTTNKKYRIIEFYIHKPSLVDRIKKRINKIKIYPGDRKYFSDYFHTKNDIRKIKLKKLNK